MKFKVGQILLLGTSSRHLFQEAIVTRVLEEELVRLEFTDDHAKSSNGWYTQGFVRDWASYVLEDAESIQETPKRAGSWESWLQDTKDRGQ